MHLTPEKDHLIFFNLFVSYLSSFLVYFCLVLLYRISVYRIILSCLVIVQCMHIPEGLHELLFLFIYLLLSMRRSVTDM